MSAQVEKLFEMPTPVGAMINDPFGEDVLDFPMHAYIEELKDTMLAFEVSGVANPAVEETPASGSAKAVKIKAV